MYLVNIWEGWRAAYNIVWTVEVDGVFVLKFKTVREGVHKKIVSFYTKNRVQLISDAYQKGPKHMILKMKFLR